MTRDRIGRPPRDDGNSGGPAGDLPPMGSLDCATCREELSADLDGEGDPARRADARAHLEACADCTRWREQAAVVTRLTRTAPAEAGPDLVAAVLPAARARPGGASAPGWPSPSSGRARSCSGCSRFSARPVTAPARRCSAARTWRTWCHETAAWNLALGQRSSRAPGGPATSRAAPGPRRVHRRARGAQRPRPRGRAGRARPGRDARAAARRVRAHRPRRALRPRARTGPRPVRAADTGWRCTELARTGSGPAPARRGDLGPVARDRSGGPARRDAA